MAQMRKKVSKIPKIRRKWVINPKTRIRESLKRYKRAKAKKELRKIRKRVKDEENT